MADRMVDTKVYIGDLGNDATREEIEEAFGRFGPMKNVWVARRPPGFAFVEFEHPRDAADAARAVDGRMLCGRRVRVEVSHGRSRWPGGRPPAHLLRRPAPRWVSDRTDDRCLECGRIGHSTRDCQIGGGMGGKGKSSSSSRSRSRSRDRNGKRRRKRSSSGSSRSSTDEKKRRKKTNRSRSKSAEKPDSPRRKKSSPTEKKPTKTKS